LHRENGEALCPPAFKQVWRWFMELCRSRGKHTIIISSMAGSQVITEAAPVTWREIESWSRMTGRTPNRWEAQQLATMDTVYVNAANAAQGRKRTDQGIGEYCGNKDLAACRKMLGEKMLPKVCSTCPD
jgi:hypothetical protein